MQMNSIEIARGNKVLCLEMYSNVCTGRCLLKIIMSPTHGHWHSSDIEESKNNNNNNNNRIWQVGKSALINKGDHGATY